MGYAAGHASRGGTATTKVLRDFEISKTPVYDFM